MPKCPVVMPPRKGLIPRHVDVQAPFLARAVVQWLVTLPKMQDLVNQRLATLRQGQASPWDFLRMGRPVKRQRRE